MWAGGAWDGYALWWTDGLFVATLWSVEAAMHLERSQTLSCGPQEGARMRAGWRVGSQAGRNRGKETLCRSIQHLSVHPPGLLLLWTSAQPSDGANPNEAPAPWRIRGEEGLLLSGIVHEMTASSLRPRRRARCATLPCSSAHRWLCLVEMQSSGLAGAYQLAAVAQMPMMGTRAISGERRQSQDEGAALIGGGPGTD